MLGSCPRDVGSNPTPATVYVADLVMHDTVNNISREELKNLIRTKTFIYIGEQYGVSDNAVRKWCDKYNLPRTKKEINTYSDKEWDLL